MTDFQHLVYQGLLDIPEGKVTTYAGLAHHIGRPKAVRAVGTALGKNTQIGEIPCHRVVRGDGSVGQFALGSDEKIKMLRAEGVQIVNSNVDLLSHGIFIV